MWIRYGESFFVQGLRGWLARNSLALALCRAQSRGSRHVNSGSRVGGCFLRVGCPEGLGFIRHEAKWLSLLANGLVCAHWSALEAAKQVAATLPDQEVETIRAASVSRMSWTYQWSMPAVQF